MTFELTVRMVELAEQYDTVEYTVYDPDTHSLSVYFANGTSWRLEVRG